MPKVELDNIDACECCGTITETTRNKKTGEYLCWECLTAIEENNKITEVQKQKKEIEQCLV